MKAVSLFSGGLDSLLAVCLIKDQGIEVVGVNFVSPFFGAEPGNRKAAAQLGIEYHELDIGPEYMDVLKKPVYGYGKNFNPCIDCHGFMLNRAGRFMEEIGASFLITGEVVGERPMSQNKSALRQVEKLSGYPGLVLRPLSARLLEPTIPEKEGWVDRSRLLDISGRSRTRQMQLAEHYSIKEYPTPAGGCLLTQENFSRRLRRVLTIKPDIEAGELEILKVGRHFYLSDGELLMVGRNHSENERLQKAARTQDYLIKVNDRPGPLGLLRRFDQDGPPELALAAAIVARYSDARDLDSARVSVIRPGHPEPDMLMIRPLRPEEVPPSV
ncbi:MAG: tRNA 4-thiouridine(8) synthase ThiI [Syntrophomonadaceae bacterium]